MTVRAALTLALALFATPAAAQDTPAPPPPLLNAMFSDHAVLQRGQPVRVWGNAAPRARVTVTLASARRVVRADSAGAWSATLPAMSAGGPYELTARTPGASQTASDVMVGDVYLCSGQSNIEFSVRGALNGAFEASRANDTNIRHMRIEQRAIGEPQTNFANAPPWQVASPETVPGFSAACYFMARELRRTIDVPMGLVTSAWGGSNIRAWVSQPTLRTVGQWNQALDMLALHQRDPLAGEAAWGEMAEAVVRAQLLGVRPALASGSRRELDRRRAERHLGRR
ncbi:MAG: carboxypeptidase-like regulatory domain-containing protein [Terricaulis sp.]